MAIAVGALVDDAIIDVENVYKRLRDNVKLPVDQRKPILKVVQLASIEIRSSIITATLIIIVSFVPLFFLSGMEGRLLTPLGIAFITSVLTSLVVAVTLTPVLCSYLLHQEKTLVKQAKGTKLERLFQKIYSAILQKSLSHSRLVVGSTVVLFGFSLVIFFGLGRSFLPEFNEGALVINAVTKPGISLEESDKIGQQVEATLLEFEEINVVTRRTGRAELAEHTQGVNASELELPYTLKTRTKEEFYSKLRTKLGQISGVNITIGQPIGHRIDHMLSGTRANIAIKVFGDDLAKLFELGKEIETLVKTIEGTADVAVDQQIEVPQLRIVPSRQLLAAHGMTIADLFKQLDAGIAGEQVGQIYEGQKHFDLVVRYEKRARDQKSDLENTLIHLPNGGFASLNMLAKVQSVGSPNSISRENVQRKIVVALNVHERDLRSAVNEIESKINSGIVLPQGYRIEFGGQFESETKASQLLLLSAVLAIGIIFLLLYLEFNSLRLASIVLVNLPLALIGGILIVKFTSGIVSIAGTIGFISLLGIATRNGILLISRYEDLKLQGYSGPELLTKGALDRLNPILMTAFTTGLALIPLALKGSEAGNEIQSPMAIVILGGLFSATFLNLLVIPSVYRLFGTTDKHYLKYKG
jgi:CzcA family heavy metal efflux pump